MFDLTTSRRGGPAAFLALTGWMTCGLPVASAQTLPEMARQRGGEAGNVIDVEVPIGWIQEVVANAELVVRGEILTRRTLLNSDQTRVETEYTIRPIEVLKDQRRQAVKTPGTVPAIVIRHTGGHLVTEAGLRLSTSIDIFPDAEGFSVGEDVVVMLRFRPDEEVYGFSHGPFGAFRVRDGMVVPMTGEVEQRRKDAPTPVAAF